MGWAGAGEWRFPGGSGGKESACDAEDPGSGRSRGEGNGYPLQYYCLGNPMDRGAWLAMVHRVRKSWTHLKQLIISSYHICSKKYVKRQIKRVNTIFPTVVTSQETRSEKGPNKFLSIDVTFRIKI